MGAKDGKRTTSCSGKTASFIISPVHLVWYRFLQNTWADVNNIEQLLCQKETQVQTVHARYLAEIEKLTRKLQQRDDTLKRVLHAKVRSNPASGPMAAKSSYPVSSRDERDHEWINYSWLILALCVSKMRIVQTNHTTKCLQGCSFSSLLSKCRVWRDW